LSVRLYVAMFINVRDNFNFNFIVQNIRYNHQTGLVMLCWPTVRWIQNAYSSYR